MRRARSRICTRAGGICRRGATCAARPSPSARDALAAWCGVIMAALCAKARRGARRAPCRAICLASAVVRRPRLRVHSIGSARSRMQSARLARMRMRGVMAALTCPILLARARMRARQMRARQSVTAVAGGAVRSSRAARATARGQRRSRVKTITTGGCTARLSGVGRARGWAVKRAAGKSRPTRRNARLGRRRVAPCTRVWRTGRCPLCVCLRLARPKSALAQTSAATRRRLPPCQTRSAAPANTRVSTPSAPGPRATTRMSTRSAPTTRREIPLQPLHPCPHRALRRRLRAGRGWTRAGGCQTLRQLPAHSRPRNRGLEGSHGT